MIIKVQNSDSLVAVGVARLAFTRANNSGRDEGKDNTTNDAGHGDRASDATLLRRTVSGKVAHGTASNEGDSHGGCGLSCRRL